MKKTSLKKLKFKKRFEYLRSIVFDEKSLRKKGVVFEVVKFPSKKRNTPHVHKTTSEIFFILSGKGFLDVQGKKIRIMKDDILLVPPSRKHQVINSTNEDLVILVFKIGKSGEDTFF